MRALSRVGVSLPLILVSRIADQHLWNTFDPGIASSVTGCVKMYENRWFDNVGATKADQAAPAAPNSDADDTPSKMADGSMWPRIRKLLPAMTTVSAWGSRRSRRAAGTVLAWL